jgi:hypothetical protein
MILSVGMVGGALRRRCQPQPKVTFAFFDCPLFLM